MQNECITFKYIWELVEKKGKQETSLNVCLFPTFHKERMEMDLLDIWAEVPQVQCNGQKQVVVLLRDKQTKYEV